MWHFRQEGELRHFLYERKYRKGDHWIYVYPWEGKDKKQAKANDEASENALRKAAAESRDIGRAQQRGDNKPAEEAAAKKAEVESRDAGRAQNREAISQKKAAEARKAEAESRDKGREQERAMKEAAAKQKDAALANYASLKGSEVRDYPQEICSKEFIGAYVLGDKDEKKIADAGQPLGSLSYKANRDLLQLQLNTISKLLPYTGYDLELAYTASGKMEASFTKRKDFTEEFPGIKRAALKQVRNTVESLYKTMSKLDDIYEAYDVGPYSAESQGYGSDFIKTIVGILNKW